MHQPPLKHRSILICLALTAVTIGTFWPVLKCGFVRYDDDRYITDNPRIKAALEKQQKR